MEYVCHSSGSGKTSLLNALNFRQNKSLVIDGKIMLNGHVCDATRMAMVSSYIQQDDLFYGMLTVKEHLVFQASGLAVSFLAGMACCSVTFSFSTFETGYAQNGQTYKPR